MLFVLKPAWTDADTVGAWSSRSHNRDSALRV